MKKSNLSVYNIIIMFKPNAEKAFFNPQQLIKIRLNIFFKTVKCKNTLYIRI